jgi:hypothetical protein
VKKKVLYYKGCRHEDTERLQKILEATLHDQRLDIHETVEGLSGRLRQIGNGVGIAVLFVAGREDLMNILEISDLLHDISTILILPDGAGDIVAKALTLRPRFLSYVHSNYMDVAKVLDKILVNMGMKSRGRVLPKRA